MSFRVYQIILPHCIAVLYQFHWMHHATNFVNVQRYIINQFVP